MFPLPVIYTGERKPELDIISIPGLPSLSPQYKRKDHTPWLREVLSHHIPQARIMTFQYDYAQDAADVTWRGLLQNAEGLLYSIVHRREEANQRPIIFVCYSFGAFILKKALLIAKENSAFREVFDLTKGIIFLTALNDESYPGFQDICLKCAAVEFGTKKKHDAIESLKRSKDWSVILEVTESFRTARCSFAVRTLYEKKATSLTGGVSLLKGRKSECLCSELIAALGWKNEELIGIQKDHHEMIMYPNRGDTQGYFETFMTTISQLVAETCPSTPKPLVGSPSASSDDMGTWQMSQMLRNRTISSMSFENLSLNPSNHSIYEAISGTSSPPLKNVNIPCRVLSQYPIHPDFVGRDDVLVQIRTTLDPNTGDATQQKVFVIAGLGGMGKTQVALSYATYNQGSFEIILWANADSESKLAESFSEFARELGLGEDLSSIKAKQAVLSCLQELEIPYLIVFDNADDAKAGPLKDYWPGKNPKASVLITTRDQTLLAQYPGIELSEISEKNAVQLLLNLTKHQRVNMSPESIQEQEIAAKGIVRNIGYLPLGISQAATLVINESYSLAEFLEAYDARDIIEDGEDVQLMSGDNSYRYSLGTVWTMNFDRLGEDQQKLLQIMSFLDPDRLPMTTLKDGAAKANCSDLAFIDTSRKLTKCKSALLRSTLVSQSLDGKILKMHRLVQVSCQLKMSLEQRRTSFASGIALVEAVWDVPPRMDVWNPAFWAAQRALLPHVQKLCEFYVKSSAQGESLVAEGEANWAFASILYEAGWFCYESGLLESVCDLLLPAEKYCLERLDKGGGYRILADIYGGLGSFQTESNQFQAAFDSFSSQWKYLTLAFEAGELQRPSIWEVFGLGRLANGFQGLHKYQEAETYYRKCLASWEELPGDRKMWVTHLATCMWLQGRLDEAEQTVRPVIKDWNDATNHRTSEAMFCLGNIQIAQARSLTETDQKELAQTKLSEAMTIHTKVVELRIKACGGTHQKTAHALYKMGWHFHRRKEYKQAIKYLEKALDVYVSKPSILQNEIARTRYKLGCVYQDTGMTEKGTALIKEAEVIRQTIVRPECWEPAKGEEDFDEIVQFWTR